MFNQRESDQADFGPRFVVPIDCPDFGPSVNMVRFSAWVLSGLEPSQDWAAQYIPKMLIGLAIISKNSKSEADQKDSTIRSGSDYSDDFWYSSDF